MTDLSALGLATAFAAGVVSFLSPCVLPLVPAYVSYVSGDSLQSARPRRGAQARVSAATLSMFFVIGFSAVFITLGASASALGQLLLKYRYETNIIGGVIVMIFGLAMLGLAQPIAWFNRDFRFHPALRSGHPAAALVLGLAFGFGWTPCIGPVLGAILTVSAAQGTVAGGVVLLTAYSLGLGVPFLISAVFTGEIAGRLKSLGRLGSRLQMAAGAIMIVMGLAMVTGQLTRFGFWLLETFPALGRIG